MKIIKSVLATLPFLVFYSLLVLNVSDAKSISVPFGTCRYSGECINLRLELVQGINQEYLNKKVKFLKDSFCENNTEAQSTYNQDGVCATENALGYCGPISGNGTQLEPGIALVIVYYNGSITPKDPEVLCKQKGGNFSVKNPYP